MKLNWISQTTFIVLDPSRDGTGIGERNESLAIAADALDTQTICSRGFNSTGYTRHFIPETNVWDKITYPFPNFNGHG